MDTSEVNIYAAKTHFSRLVARAEHGDRVTITRNGHPVARLVPYVADEVIRAPGAWSGKVQIADDFDELSDQELNDWYGE